MAKSYEELTFTDGFMFRKVMETREDLCRELVRMATGRVIRKVIRPEAEKDLKFTPESKGVRLDVYFEDQKDVVYEIEMQPFWKKALPQRSRYYQGMIDLNIIEKGDPYEKLRESYVIFICTFNPFGGRLHKYTFENVCLEDASIRLDDGTRKVFLCAKGTADDVSDEMKEFLSYITGTPPRSDFTKKIDEAVKKAREHNKWRLEYMSMTLFEQDARNEGRQEGMKEGMILGRILALSEEGHSHEAIKSSIMKQSHLTEAEAIAYIEEALQLV